MSEDPHLRSRTATGDVCHVTGLANDISALLSSNDYSDITFVVEEQDFHAHKVIMAARCEYFRALLFGGLRETHEGRVDLPNTSADGFRVLLQYVYSGRINLVDLKEDQLLEQLGLANRYGFSDYENAIVHYLKAIIETRNVCDIYNVANLYSLNYLESVCLNHLDRNASEILASESFLNLSANSVVAIIDRDSFCAPEEEIFRAIRSWVEANPDEESGRVIACIRLNVMQIPELLNVVRPSLLVSSDSILDAIDSRHRSNDMELSYRGNLILDENVAHPNHGAQVIRGEIPAALLNGDNTNYDLDRGFTRHPIDENPTTGIVVKLGMQCIVNCIKMLLWDKDNRSYSYRIEASMHEDRDWVTIVDHSTYLCRSWQKLYFPKKVARYFRIVGTNNTVNRVFHVVSFEAYYKEDPFTLEKGILVPKDNVATVENWATVTEGVSRSRNALINGVKNEYDWDSGYTCHQLGSGAIVVQLPQPYHIGSIRLLLWDCDSRSYSYYIDVSTDHLQWHRVVDKRNEMCQSWQTITFPPRPVCYIKIVGTHNTANEVFHCVHFECPAPASELTAAGDATSASAGAAATASGGVASTSLSAAVGVTATSTSTVTTTTTTGSSPRNSAGGQQSGFNQLPFLQLGPAQVDGYAVAFPPPRDNDTASNASTHSAASSRGGAFGGGGTPGHGHPGHPGFPRHQNHHQNPQPRPQMIGGALDFGLLFNPSPSPVVTQAPPLPPLAPGYDLAPQNIPRPLLAAAAPPLPPRGASVSPGRGAAAVVRPSSASRSLSMSGSSAASPAAATGGAVWDGDDDAEVKMNSVDGDSLAGEAIGADAVVVVNDGFDVRIEGVVPLNDNDAASSEGQSQEDE